ncbi:hypothetical protein WJX82_009701 [Trebouxia sp. C0006]
MRQQDTNGDIQTTSSLSPSGGRGASAHQPGVKEDIHAGSEHLSASDTPHLLEQSTVVASDQRPVPSAGADAASDLHENPREQASSISADKEGSSEAHPAVLEPPPELSSIRTSPPSASPQNSIALDDTEYPADLHSTPSASHSPSDATSVLSAQDNGLFPGNAALGNAHSISGANSTQQQSLLSLNSLPVETDLAPQPLLETSLAVAQLDSSKGEDSTEEASTRGVDDTESGNSPRKHRLAVQADAQGGTSQSWRQQRKHVFVLSNAGKPIWTLHGDENALAGLMAVIQALTSFVHDKGDTMQSIRAGAHLIVFLERGPFILVMASATGEPEAALTCQLGLVHAQILSILSSSVDKMFARNPSYDARKLLGATNHVLTALVASFHHDPSAMLTCLVPLALKSNLRHCALVYLQSAVKSAGALFGVLLTQKAIVAVAQSRAHVLHPHDLLLLANLVRSNESFKQAQTFTPVCLPHFNSAAFLHAYVQYLHVSGGVCLVLLSSQAESFFKLADAAQQVHRQLKQPGVLQAIVSVTEHETGGGLLSIADLPPQCGGGQVGVTPLLHFLYKSPTRGQVIMPAFDAPLDRHDLRLAAMQSRIARILSILSMARFGNVVELATFLGKLDVDYAEYAPALWQKGIKIPQQLANSSEPHYLACDVPEGHIDDIKSRADTTGTREPGEEVDSREITAGHMYRQAWPTGLLKVMGCKLHEPRNIILMQKQLEKRFDNWDCLLCQKDKMHFG